MNQETSVGRTDPFVIAAWCGAVFGLLEGTVLTVARGYPRIRAPYKVSEDILWVAPLENVVVYLALALGLILLFKSGPRQLRGGAQLLLVFALYTMLGILAATVSTGVIHVFAAVVLAIGAGVSVVRTIRGRELALTQRFRWGLFLIPAIIGLMWLGTEVYRWRRESQMAQRLPKVQGSPANVLVIVLDTVRYDSFAEGRKPGLTPNIDEVAASGTRFTHAWSTSSWSLPSQASIMTGLYPHEHGADWPGIEVDSKCPKLAELLAQRGYVTGAFSSNSSWITSEHLGRGFLRFHDYTLENLLRRTFVGRLADKVLCRVGFHSSGRGKRASRLNRDIVKFLDDYPDRPFYAYVCYMDVNREFHHHIYNTKIGTTQPLSSAYLAYKSALTTLDAQVGLLLDELKQRGRMDNTILVITSDHGESFGSEVAQDHEPPGHGTSLYDEQSRVPLFVVYPPRVPASQAVDATVSIRQIPSTIMQLLDSRDAPFPAAPLPVGPAGAAETATAAHPVLITLNYDQFVHQAVVLDRWQYIRNPEDEATPEELYDLQTDPGATKNLASDQKMISVMRDRLQQLMEDGKVEVTVRRAPSHSPPAPASARATFERPNREQRSLVDNDR